MRHHRHRRSRRAARPIDERAAARDERHASAIAAPTATAFTSSPASASAIAACRSSTSRAASSRSTTRTTRSSSRTTARSTTSWSSRPSSLQRGHTFRTRCDTEVIVHAWEEWGERLPRALQRHVRVRLWDRSKQDAVPRARSPRREAAVLRGAAGRPRWCSPRSSRRCCVHPRRAAAHRSARGRGLLRVRLRAGSEDDLSRRAASSSRAPTSACSAATARRRRVRYWDVPLAGERDRGRRAEQWQAELRERLQEAVRKRLVSDVPLGAFLSGGIDSSAVVAMMREIGAGKILTCSIGFREPRYDESHYAQHGRARRSSTDHKTEVVEASDYSLLEKLVDIYDEPYADSSAIPTYRVCQLARRHVTVALSGDGGDEDFIGYRRYQLFAMEERVRSALPLGVRRAAVRRARPLVSEARLGAASSARQDDVPGAGARHRRSVPARRLDLLRRDARSRCSRERFRARAAGLSAPARCSAAHVRGKTFTDPLALVQYLDYKTYLPGDILTKVDRASMAHSLEVRTPFLDYEFVEWVVEPAERRQAAAAAKASTCSSTRSSRCCRAKCCTARRWASPCRSTCGSAARCATHIARHGARRAARGLRHLRSPTMLVAPRRRSSVRPARPQRDPLVAADVRRLPAQVRRSRRMRARPLAPPVRRRGRAACMNRRAAHRQRLPLAAESGPCIERRLRAQSPGGDARAAPTCSVIQPVP